MKKVKLIGVIALIIINSFCLTAYAATTASQYWYQDSSGSWLINKPGVGTVKNAWVCDNATNPADTSTWYYLTADGKMAEGVLIDNGKAYLLENNHNGNYGMMLQGASSISFNGHTLTLNTQHNGTFGEILSVDGNAGYDRNSLGSLLGVKQSNAVAGAVNEYTANWGNGQAGGSQQAQQQATGGGSDDIMSLFHEGHGRTDGTSGLTGRGLSDTPQDTSWIDGMVFHN